jgi:hypothetical protein
MILNTLLIHDALTSILLRPVKMVGEEGFEPPKPEGAGFTVPCRSPSLRLSNSYGCLSTERFIPVKFNVIWNSLDIFTNFTFTL